MKYKLLFIILIFLSISSYAQDDIDSLSYEWLDDNAVDSVRFEDLYFLAERGFLDEQADSAMDFAHTVLNSAQISDNKYYQARAYFLIGAAYSEKGNFFKAKENMLLALEVRKNLGDKEEIAESYWHLGILHSNYRYFVESYENHSKALIIKKELKDSIDISGILNNIGNIYKQQGDYHRALEYYIESVNIIEKAGSYNDVAFENMIEVYIALGNHEAALNSLNQRLKIIKKEEKGEFYKHRTTASNTISVLYNLADIYRSKGEYSEAMDHYMRVLELEQKEYQRPEDLASIQASIGSLYSRMDSNNLAVEWCKKSLKGYEIYENIRGQKYACDCLYESYKALGDYSQALKYNELWYMFSDSLHLEETAASLQEMEYSNRMIADSLLQEEEKLKTELVHQSELRIKKRNQNIFLISGLIILLIAIGLWNRMRFTRKANARLKIERDRAENSEQFKHQFLANMSHEIRTPMNAIKGMIDILIRRKPKEDQISYLNSIKESSDSLLVIINDILDLSKIESGKIELELIPFHIEEMLKNVHTIMQFKAEEKGLELKMDIPNSIPGVIGDPTRIQQVMINLIGNAIKFTEKGVVTASLKFEKEENNSHINVHFTVSDTGIGIDEDKVEQVFNSFEQAYADTSRKYGGTGLGLSISKKLIELHSGKIWVESTKGVGSQFHFIIPFLVNDGTESSENESEKIDIENICDKLKGIKILLVEDNAFNVVVAQEELEDAICEAVVTVAENGAIAVEKVKHNDFDVVLMDVQMPIMNGYDATKNIRSLEGNKSKIPIIAMTANVLKEEVELCYNSGMDDFIGKPFDIDILIQKIYSITRQ